MAYSTRSMVGFVFLILLKLGLLFAALLPFKTSNFGKANSLENIQFAGLSVSSMDAEVL